MPQAIAAVAAWVTAAVVSATATTSLVVAQIIYATAYVATTLAVSAAVNYGMALIAGGGGGSAGNSGGTPSPESQGLSVASTAPVRANRHVFGRTRTAGVMAWMGSFAWQDGDAKNLGFGQCQILSSSPATEIEAVYASNNLLIPILEAYTGSGLFWAANQAPYADAQPLGQSRLYYFDDAGSDPGVRDPLLGWFADQDWQPLITSPYPDVDELVPFFSEDARGDGLAKLTSAAYQDFNSFPQGPPAMAAVLKGVAVYDPRVSGADANDESTWVFSQNCALIAAWYVTRPFGFAASYADVDIDTLIDAANICDEEVETFASTGAAGSPPTEPRYVCGGEIVEDDNRDQALAGICAAMAGSWCNVGGRWYFYAGAYTEPSVTIDDSWIMRNVSFTAQRSRMQLFNTVNGTFMSEARQWQPAPYPQVQIPALLADDGGQEIIETVDLSYVQSHTQAQRCVLIELRRTHKPRTFQFDTPMGFALRLIAGQTVALTQTGYGILAVPFRVSSWELAQQDETGAIWVNIVLDEDGADIYNTAMGDLTDARALSGESPTVPVSEGTGDGPGTGPLGAVTAVLI